MQQLFQRCFVRCLILALLALIVPAGSFGAVAISITVAPPVLPVYVQPPCPTEGYIWTPGYWAWGPAGYYWVPGVWVAPPQIGFLWTPGYWGFGGGVYLWHAGYWGPHVGFYGGVDYGFGYPGTGFVGGMWAGSIFRYNTAVWSVNTAVVHNVYVDRSVVRNAGGNRASFNGPGGIAARPTAAELAAGRDRHIQRTAAQAQHENVARADRSQFASVNHGNPGVAAMDRVNGRRVNPQGGAVNPATHANASPQRSVAPRPNTAARAPERQISRPQTHVASSPPAARQHSAPAARVTPSPRPSAPVRNEPHPAAAVHAPGGGRPATPAAHQQSAPAGHADREKRK